MTAIHPYLTFDGTCEEALGFYASVFDTEIEFMSRFSEMPEGEGFPVPEEHKNRIMHASMRIGGSVLMASDSAGRGEAAGPGGGFSLSVATDSVGETDRLFGRLSEGGEAIMAPADTFWGAYFGMCRDRFGVSWMLNHAPPAG